MLNSLKNARTVADLQQALNNIYKHVNAGRHWDYEFGYLVRSCGFMSVHAADRRALPLHVLRALSWLFSIASRYEIDVAEQYLRRFPGRCYYCVSAPCVCHRTQKLPPSYIPAFRLIEERGALFNALSTDITFRNLVIDFTWIRRNIEAIYPNNEVIWIHAGAGHAFTKLVEELGELHQAISNFEAGQQSKENFGREIADVFAWIMTIAIMSLPTANLHDDFVSYYMDGCPICRNSNCKCEARQEKRSGAVDIEILNKIEGQVAELMSLLQNRHIELADISKSLRSAISTQSEQVTVQAIGQTRHKMEDLAKTISTADEIGQKSFSLVQSIIKLASGVQNFFDSTP